MNERMMDEWMNEWTNEWKDILTEFDVNLYY